MSNDTREKIRAWVNNWKEVGALMEKLDDEEVKKSFDTLTNLRGMWVATPWDYNSSRWLKFESNQLAQLCFGYGQTIYAVINARFEISEPKIMNLSYLDSPAVAFFKGYTPQNNHLKKLFFMLFEEHNIFTKATTGQEVYYDWKLLLSESPFPGELQFPYETPLEFYGHRICN